MTVGPVAASTFQYGLESVRGTEVVATRILIPDSALLRRIEELHPFEGQLSGLASRSVRSPANIRNGAEFEIVHPLDFEQSMIPFMAGMLGGVTAAVIDTTAQQWTFTPPVAADPVPDTFTIEAIEDDFTNERNHQFLYGFCTQISIDSQLGGIPELSYTLAGRKVNVASKTPALSLPTDLNPIAAGNLFTLDVDAAWASLGTTQIVGQLLSFTWSWEGYLFPRITMDGRADLDFVAYGVHGGRVADLTMQVLVDPDSGFVQTEEANKAAGTGRAIRLELDTGVLIGSATQNRLMRIDGFYFHVDDSMSERFGQEQDGEMVASVHLQSTHEATEAQDAEVTFFNTLATFP